MRPNVMAFEGSSEAIAEGVVADAADEVNFCPERSSSEGAVGAATADSFDDPIDRGFAVVEKFFGRSERGAFYVAVNVADDAERNSVEGFGISHWQMPPQPE